MAAQAGMRVVPTRGLAYTQEPLAFVDESSVAFPFGSGVRVNFLAPDRGDGDGEFLWEENTWTEVTALASSWRMGRIAVCVAGKLNPPILLYSYPDKVQRGKLEGGVSHRYKCAAFCRSGERLAAIGTETDKRLVVWSLHRAGEGDAYRLEGSKLVETHLPGAMSFCSFNPANPDAMVTGGDTGLVLWHAVDLVDKWTISSSQLPKVSSTDMNAGMLSSQKRPGSSIASHAWGVNGTLWAAHTSGDIVCYDTKGGVEICNVRAGEVADEAVAMIVTKTYLIVAARSGALTWFSLPTPGGDVTVFVTASLSSPLSSVACSPLFDKLVAGTMDGKLLTVPIEAERHQSGLDATEIRSFHRGRVLSVASLRSLPSTAFEPAECVIASGGEDGFIRLYSSGVRPRSRGTRHFVHDGAPLPVTSLAATPLRPLLAAGLGCGVVHVLFAHNVSVCSESDPACSDDQVALTTIWREQLFSASGVAPVTLLAFHPTEALLAIGSSGDRSIFVVNLASPSGAFRICTHAVAPSRADDAIAGVTSLMWRGMNLIFSTGDNILCCADVDPAADASGSSPDKLRWSFSTTKPLHGMCLHPIISSGPFFAVSAERCALLVLPALPEKALGSREDRPPLDFLDALEAHDKSTTALSASIDGKFIATGGADGLVVLWRVYEQHVELLHTTRSHSGPITTLAFSMDSRALYSSSTDGTFVGLSLRNNGTQTSDEQGMATNTDRFLSSSFPPLDPSLASLAEECVNPLETLDQLPWKDEVAYEDSEPRKSVDGHQEVEQGNAASQALLSRMEEFKGRLHALLAHNSSRADVEKLSSDELIVDVRGRERAMATNRAAASELLSELRAKSMRREVIAARIRKECLESMEVRACQVWALQRPGIFVDNFPLRKRSKAEIARVEGVRRLRAIELRDIRRSGHITAKSWKGLLDEVPSDMSWMLGEGTLLPVVDLVRKLKLDSEQPKGKQAAKGVQKPSQDAPAKGEAEEEDEEEAPTLDALAKETADEQDTVGLLYPPLALYTPRQKRTQIVLLGELLREMRAAFNAHFQTLHAAKDDCMDKINERSARLEEIANELESGEKPFRPTWQASELVDSILDIDKEVTTAPYESPAQKAARAKEEEEQRRRDAARAGDDAMNRALDDMMNGTLAVKEQILLAISLPRPECLGEDGIPLHNLSAEEQKEVIAYEAALAELEEARDNRRKALELEAKKLKTEVSDLVRAFDDRVTEMYMFRFQVQRAIASQELFMSRIAVGIVNREDDEVTLEKIDRSLGEAVDRHNIYLDRVKAFKAHVDMAKEKVDALLAEDRALAQNFKKDIQESASNPIDMADMMAQLVQLYKLRDGSMVNGEGSAADGGHGSNAFGMSSARTSYRKSSMMRGNVSQSAAGGWSRRKRSSRVSNLQSSHVGSQAAGSAGLGPLQNAMKEALNREKKAVIVELDPFCAVDEAIDLQAAQNADEGGAASHQLEYPGFDIEDQIWNRLLELRADKISKEQEVRKAQKDLAEMRHRLDTLLEEEVEAAKAIEALEMQRYAVSESARTGEKNLEVIVNLKQGQDEVPHEAVVTDYSDAALIRLDVVNHLNSEIRQLGDEKSKVLHRIKDFRKSINMQKWEGALVDAKCRDLDAYYTDLQLLRVTKKLQATLKGGGEAAAAQRQASQRLEARVEMLTKSHAEKMASIRTANARLARDLKDRMTENVSLEDGMDRLKESVSAREAILSSKSGIEGQGDPAQKAAARMKQVTVRRRLVDMAKAQTDEIAALAVELDRLRQRTFPSFIHAARNNKATAVYPDMKPGL